MIGIFSFYLVLVFFSFLTVLMLKKYYNLHKISIAGLVFNPITLILAIIICYDDDNNK